MNILDKELTEFKKELIDLLNIALEKEIKKGRYKAELYAIIEFSFYDKLKLGVCKLLEKGSSLVYISSGAIGAVVGFTILGILIPGFNILELIGGLISGITSSLFIFFSLQLINKEKLLKKKLNDAKDTIQKNYLRLRTKFCRLYKSTIKETKDLFNDLLTIACSDLSQIEKETWKELKEKYKRIKDDIIKEEQI